MSLSQRIPLPRASVAGGPRLRGLAAQAGFTLFELVVAVIVIAFLATFFFKRFLTYQEMAEKAAMEQTAGAVKSGLTIQMVGLIGRGRQDEVVKLAAINPIKVLAELPPNYVGEFYNPKPGDIPEGSWYFDLKEKHLVYLVKLSDRFEADENGNKWVRYRIRVDREEMVLDAKVNGNPSAVLLELAKAYSWNLQ